MKTKRFALSLGVPLILTLVITACGGAPTAPQVVPQTVVVRETVPPQVIEVTREVEKVVTAAPVSYGEIVWLSTQLRPVQEAERVRGVILADFPGKVEFVPEDEGPFADRVAAEVRAGRGTVSLLGALHGNFTTMAAAGQLEDLTALRRELQDRGIPDAFWQVAQMGTDKTYYIPWMQATYIMAINKKALEYLPAGVDVNALTYDQLAAWAKAIYEKTGSAKFGLPAGEKGLLHRFFQGYLIPAFSGGVVTTFASDDAAAGWKWLGDVWPYVHPQSTTYNFMQEPLLSEEVWIAWDHTARLKDAFENKPDDFLAVPSPAGPKGRAFMPVLAGLAIPVTSPNRAGAEALIKYLTSPEVQITTLREVGFFPVVAVDYPGFVSPGIKLEGEAVTAQSGSPDALPALLPIGLGAKSADFNKIFLDSFRRIVLNGEDIATVLAEQKVALQALMNETGAPCWAPDPDSGGQPCQVK
ncbi:MAG: ABC transporter substrate-binding protein [Chloroflexota bacterium]